MYTDSLSLQELSRRYYLEGGVRFKRPRSGNGASRVTGSGGTICSKCSPIAYKVMTNIQFKKQQNVRPELIAILRVGVNAKFKGGNLYPNKICRSFLN